MTFPSLRATVVTVFVLSSVHAYAANERESTAPPSLHVLRIQDDEVKVDGYLTEDAWKRAEVSTGFVQRQPSDGAPSTERTEVRVLFTSDAIYVGVHALDSDPEEIGRAHV